VKQRVWQKIDVNPMRLGRSRREDHALAAAVLRAYLRGYFPQHHAVRGTGPGVPPRLREIDPCTRTRTPGRGETGDGKAVPAQPLLAPWRRKITGAIPKLAATGPMAHTAVPRSRVLRSSSGDVHPERAAITVISPMTRVRARPVSKSRSILFIDPAYAVGPLRGELWTAVRTHSNIGRTPPWRAVLIAAAGAGCSHWPRISQSPRIAYAAPAQPYWRMSIGRRFGAARGLGVRNDALVMQRVMIRCTVTGQSIATGMTADPKTWPARPIGEHSALGASNHTLGARRTLFSKGQARREPTPTHQSRPFISGVGITFPASTSRTFTCG